MVLGQRRVSRAPKPASTASLITGTSESEWARKSTRLSQSHGQLVVLVSFSGPEMRHARFGFQLLGMSFTSCHCDAHMSPHGARCLPSLFDKATATTTITATTWCITWHPLCIRHSLSSCMSMIVSVLSPPFE